MKLSKTIIAACVTTLFASAAAQAATFDEEGWKKTKSYGDVTVAEDSSDAWGPWAGFVEPAAGGPTINPIAFLGAGAGGLYQNIPGTTQTQSESFCGTGSWCGYAIYTSSQDSSGRERSAQQPKRVYNAGLFELNLAATPESNQPEMQTFMYTPTGYAPTYPGTASWKLGTLDGEEVATSSELWANFGGGTFSPEEGHVASVFGWKTVKIGRLTFVVWGKVGEQWVVDVPEGARFDNRDDDLHHFFAGGKDENGYASVSGFSHNGNANEATNEIPATKILVLSSLKVFGHTFHYLDWEKISPFTDAIAQADRDVAIGTLSAYIRGNEEIEVPSRSVSGYYVAGIATPANEMARLQSGNVNATYNGGSFDGSRQGYVKLEVQFGAGTWNGTWFGGLENSAMNFNASGKINGANISGTNVTASAQNAANVSYKGSVSGTFYGQSASSVGGVSSVQKSVGTQVVQTQNAVFLANRVSDVK